MRHLIPSLTYLLLSSPITGSLAARPCPSPASPIQWTASEWTYDAPDPTGRGRAALDSVVGLYLVVGGVDFSCFGSWPEPREGFADEEGRALVWFSCVVNRGRMVDDTVSFAVDWRNNNRTLYAAHSFVCSDGDRKGLVFFFPSSFLALFPLFPFLYFSIFFTIPFSFPFSSSPLLSPFFIVFFLPSCLPYPFFFFFSLFSLSSMLSSPPLLKRKH